MVSATDLIRWCRECLISYKIPEYMEFTEMSPKSKVEKLLRCGIKEKERQGMRKE